MANNLNTTGQFITVSAAGEMTNATQPAFLAQVSATINNVTGDGTVYGPVIFDTEIYDQNADYDNTTATFTAPITGRYSFAGLVYGAGLNTAMTSDVVQLIASNRNATVGQIDLSINPLVSTLYPIIFTIDMDMDAADTIYVQWTVSGSTKTAGVLGSPGTLNSAFGGMLIA